MNAQLSSTENYVEISKKQKLVTIPENFASWRLFGF